MESDDEMKGKSSGLNLGKTRSIESIKSDYFLEKVYIFSLNAVLCMKKIY